MILLKQILGFITNSTNADIVAANKFIEDLKGNQNVEKVRALLNSLVVKTEIFASNHTTIPSVHFDYSDLLFDKNTSFDAVYNLDYPNSLDEYIATLKEMINSLSSNGEYNVTYSYDDAGVINEIFIKGQSKQN